MTEGPEKMVELTEEQKSKFQALSDEFREKYLQTEQGKTHLRYYDQEKKEVKEVFGEIEVKHEKGKDITEDVLRRLLPHSDTKYTREKGYRASTWPAITKDIKRWFENIGWQKKENWPKVAESLFELIDGLVKDKNPKHIDEFVKSEYSKGFQTGMISPILYCLDSSLLVINSKTVDTVNYILNEEIISNRLEEYFENIKIVDELLKKSGIPLFESFDRFDMFCHWMCTKRLGGYARFEKEAGEAPKFEKKIEIPELSHWDVMGILLKLGNRLGYKTYVANPSKKYEGQKLSELAKLQDIPEKFRGIRDMDKVDVIWFADKPPYYFFEVEDKGTMREALHRLYQAVGLEAKFLIVSPVENRSKFEKWINTEPYVNVKEKYQFKSYEDLVKFFEEAEVYYRLREGFLGA